MSLLASETQKKVAACRAALDAVEGHLEPLLARSSSEVARQLAPLEHAELQVSLAYAVGSLYFCHLLTQGVNPAEHPLKQELDRIQLYFKKVRSAAEEAKQKQAEQTRGHADADFLEQVGQDFLRSAEAVMQEGGGAAAARGSRRRSAAAAGAAEAEAAGGDAAGEAADAPQRPKKLRKKVRKKSAGGAAA